MWSFNLWYMHIVVYSLKYYVKKETARHWSILDMSQISAVLKLTLRISWLHIKWDNRYKAVFNIPYCIQCTHQLRIHLPTWHKRIFLLLVFTFIHIAGKLNKKETKNISKSTLHNMLQFLQHTTNLCRHTEQPFHTLKWQRNFYGTYNIC